MAMLEHEIPAEIERAIQRRGAELWQRVMGESPGRLSRGYWHGQLMDWAMRDEGLKTALFRLTDVLPALRDPADVAAHARSYLDDEAGALPFYVRAPVKLARIKRLQRPLRRVAAIFEGRVRALGRRFIAGATLDEAVAVLQKLWAGGATFTIDLLGEKTLSGIEADSYQRRCLEALDRISEEAGRFSPHPVLETTPRGPLPRASVSIKLSALDPALDVIDIEGAVSRLRKRLLPILLRAKERDVSVTLDMEQWALHEITLCALEDVLEHETLRGWPHAGVAVQAYLARGLDDLERLCALARRRAAPIWVRLVKGAYWDHEVVVARQFGYACPVLLEKAATDANYEAMTDYLLDHAEEFYSAFASHNLRSLSHAIVQAERRGMAKDAYEIQMLYGMAEPEQRALSAMGHRVRLYTPIGELVPGMAYLVRRLLENTSNRGFLRLAYRENVDMLKLLKRPEPTGNRAEASGGRARRGESREFVNCPLTDFTDRHKRARFAEAMRDAPGSFPRVVPVVANGEVRTGGIEMARRCPSDTSMRVAIVTAAQPVDAEKAVTAALRAWPGWSARPVRERAEVLEAIADSLEAERVELAALEVYEAGKPWREADADVAEAIDFCRYYARRALEELGTRKLGELPGEVNTLSYEGRGPTAVIAPWNFPIAILCGMSAAALAAGNPVVLKPAEQSSACGYALFQCMQKAGIPDDVAHFLPGIGEEIGSYLVAHPGIAMIAFTGSMKVGLSILERAGRTPPGQPWVKSVVCEMGGKNAIIIDRDADLDEAVAGVVESAFGYAGQKCSACSRVIVLGAVFETFLSRLIEATRSLNLAPAHDPGCEIGPVIDEAALERLLSVIASPGEGATRLYVGASRDSGYYAPPAIFQVEDPKHPLMQRELFGPILAVMRVIDFDEAIEVALATPFALTGGVYSRDPAHLDAAAQRFRVGNLYFNRPCTGARVGRQPFGGFGMSGTGTKAGGPGYLRHFAVPRCVTEKTTRKGFTPEVTI